MCLPGTNLLQRKGLVVLKMCIKNLMRKKARALLSDGTQSVYYLADMSGDGLSDLVRIRNGEVCYWPNLDMAVLAP